MKKNKKNKQRKEYGKKIIYKEAQDYAAWLIIYTHT